MKFLKNKEIPEDPREQKNVHGNEMGLNVQNLRNYKHFNTYLYIHV